MGDLANAALSPRASIALLTLQLRAAQRDAEEAERAEHEWNGDAAAAELRERLEPMVREQRRTFELELWQARAAASARVQAVRNELAARPTPIVSVEHDVAEPVEPEVVEPEVFEADVFEPEVVEAEVVEAECVEPEVAESVAREARPLAAPPVDAVPVGVPPIPPSVVAARANAESDADAGTEPPRTSHVVGDQTAGVADTREEAAAARSRRDPESAPPLTADEVRSIVDEAIDRFAARQAASPPPNAGMDPEAFSRAFAAAFGAAFSAMLDDRLAALNAGPPVAPWMRYPAPMPVEVKKSFWTNMWHADVMLSVLAAVIVLVILIAWST